MDNTSPNTPEAEQTVLGVILFDPDKFDEVNAILTPDDFYLHSHRYIYSAMTGLSRRKEPIDIMTVSEYLSDSNQLEAANGRTYLMDIAMAVVTAQNVIYYAKIVKRSSIRRLTIKLCKEAIYEASELPDSETALKTLSDGIKKLCFENNQDKDKTHSELAQDVLNKLQRDMESPNGMSGILSGFKGLDNAIGSLKGGDIIILAARPSMGKSALSFNLAQGSARSSSKNILYFSLEMTPEQIAKRGLSADAEIDLRRLTLSDLQKLSEVSENVSNNLYILDRPTLNVRRLKADLLKYQNIGQGLGVVFIDYLQLMSNENKSKNTNRNLEIGEITRELKALAREFNVCIVVLSQLSRNVESRQDKRPMLSDLRDSGSIEQDADVVAFIYRDEYYNKEKSERPGMVELLIEKNRDGRTAMIELTFRPSIVKFSEPMIANIRNY